MLIFNFVFGIFQNFFFNCVLEIILWDYVQLNQHQRLMRMMMMIMSVSSIVELSPLKMPTTSQNDIIF